MRAAPPLLLAALVAAGCRSSAPYTVPSAAINTGFAVGAALAERAAGGCYSVCSDPLVCNPRSGLCEKAPSTTEVCEPAPGGGVRCVPWNAPAIRGQAGAAGVAGGAGSIGVSPATGTFPPPPAEASPGKP